MKRWTAYPDRPHDWLHHKAITHNRVNRLAVIERLRRPDGIHSMALATIAEWLEALVTDKEGDEAIRSSKAAILTAASIPTEIRTNEELGHIVLTANSDYVSPDPDCVFLCVDCPDDAYFIDTVPCVHPELSADPTRVLH